MKQTLEEQIEKVINENEIFITIKESVKDEYNRDDMIFRHLELEEYIENKEKYEKYFISISYEEESYKFRDIGFLIRESLNNYFNEITDKEKFKDENSLNNHINGLVDEHIKLYKADEIENYIKILLNI